MKKLIIGIIVAGIGISCSSIAMATEKTEGNNRILSIEEQNKEFERISKEIKEGKIKIVSDKTGNKSVKSGENSTGTYPTRKGTFIVTNAAPNNSITGHSGIVLDSTHTVESNPGSGVQYGTNNWTNRYRNVWGATTNGTTPEQDSAAADWAISQIGKPYSIDFLNIETTKKFYCSQLVYKAYKEASGVNLNHKGGIVFPFDLIDSENSSVIYTYKR